MKTTFYDLMYDMSSDEYRLAPLSAEETECIREKTMKKLTQEKPRRSAKPLRAALIAAAAAVLLCGTAFAAYTNGWFGHLFGEKSVLIEKDVTEFNDNATLTLPTYTDEEQAMIEEGAMQVPSQATLLGGASAETEDFCFTLESMLASKHSLYAIVRGEAKTDAAAALLTELGSDASDAQLFEEFIILAENDSGEGHEREWKNGGMSWKFLTQEDGAGLFVLTNTGGEFVQGDSIRFTLYCNGENYDLFCAALPALMDTERSCVPNDAAGSRECGWDTVTLTPIELRLDGHYSESPNEMMVSEISVTLRDGTHFELAAPANGYRKTEYGSLGALSFSGTTNDDGCIKYSWLFSQLIEPEEVRSVTINGTEYLLG